jgi:uncharacterized membrane protein
MLKIQIRSGQMIKLIQWPRLFGVGAEGARQMLSTLAGSMMTVMGITFSMTLLALVLASGQYTSRILRNFMRNSVAGPQLMAGNVLVVKHASNVLSPLNRC